MSGPVQPHCWQIHFSLMAAAPSWQTRSSRTPPWSGIFEGKWMTPMPRLG